MKKKISIAMALLMVVSTFAIGTVNVTADGETIPEENLDVCKTIWNGNAWVDEYYAEVGETVTFNITVTYYENCGYLATDIIVIDFLDTTEGVTYTLGEFSIDPSMTGHPIQWNLTEDHGIELEDGDSISIEFNVTITSGYGELINCVQVNAKETCCGEPLYGDDCVTVVVEEEPCEPGIEVNKTVYNETSREWEEYIEGLTIGDIVQFKIVITYNDCGSGYEILNMIVKDILPCCLEYEETIEITTTGEMDEPSIDVLLDKTVYWNWTYDRHVVLHDGDTLTIIFSAEFVHYCDIFRDNIVFVEAWGCSGPTFFDEDTAGVDCTQPDNKFDKMVTDGPNKYQEINTTVGSTIRFKLSFTYYGEETYDIIKFTDFLPCILEYANEASYSIETDNSGIGAPIEGKISEDGKTIWFNFTGANLSDGETISVSFDAYVSGTTGNNCGCELEVENCATVEVYEECCQCEPVISLDDCLTIRSMGNCPPTTPFIKGPTEGVVDEKLYFTIISTDSDGDQIFYIINWDEGLNEVTPLNESGFEIALSHTYESAGTYKITAKAVDEHGAESPITPEGYEHTVIITESQVSALKISIAKTFHIKTVAGSVKNTGDTDISDVEWEFKISKGGAIGGFNIKNNGTIDSIADGASKQLLSGDVTAKLGLADIEITATENGKEAKYTNKCLVIGRFVFIIGVTI